MATRYRFRVEEFERAFQGCPTWSSSGGGLPDGPHRTQARAQGGAVGCQTSGQEALKGKAVVAVQSPLRLSEDSEPEPDLMVLKPPLERYQDRLPTPEDVLLLVEVADTSLEFDREVKLPSMPRRASPRSGS